MYCTYCNNHENTQEDGHLLNNWTLPHFAPASQVFRLFSCSSHLVSPLIVDNDFVAQQGAPGSFPGYLGHTDRLAEFASLLRTAQGANWAQR